MALYPLLFKPIVKEKVWGSETWSLSGYGDDQSEVANGFLEGNLLSEVLEVYMDELVGQKVYDRYGLRFPLLFKLIDAQDDLSVQVHPSDRMVAQEGETGKTEMWYVTKASKEASIILGFSRTTSAEEVAQRLQENAIMDVMQIVSVEQGDVAYIPAGTVHALRHGTQVAEIQETSDLTYRLYDYNRPGLDGQLRPLHIEQSLKVLDYNASKQPLTNYPRNNDERCTLVEDEHFHTSLLNLSKAQTFDYAQLDSFVVYMVVEGDAVLHTDIDNDTLADGEEQVTLEDIRVHTGDTVLIPAAANPVTVMPQNKVKLLEVFVP
ncbi:MAG: class I mannose-6-phosphate isomerase [Paludibacteraceae bacterium]|nr:class I mannose-6-phosphate isomerase [Paludibacteraceae bacterium]